MKIATLNSCEGNSQTERIIKCYNENKLDILMIQEIHCISKENIKKIEGDTKTKSYVSEGTNRGRGVMILIHESEKLKRSKIISRDNKGNIISISAENELGEIFEIINLYGPIDSKNRVQLLQEIYDRMHATTNKIIGGDFNNFENFNLYSVGGSKLVFDQKNRERKILYEMRCNHGYVDSYRIHDPHTKAFTFTK